MTEAEFEDMLTEIEIHRITFARSRCHGGNEEILDKDTQSRCRCSGCAKPAPAKAESAERVRWRRQFRGKKRSLGPVNPLTSVPLVIPLTSAPLIIVPAQVGDKDQKDKEESQNSPKLRVTNAKIG